MQFRRSLAPMALFMAMLLLTVVPAIGLQRVAAQTDAPADASPIPEEGRTMPASIREGTCTSLGAVVHQLTDIEFPENAEVVGVPAIPAYQSVTQLQESSIDDLVSEQRVVTVVRSLDDPDDIVACGLIGGTRFDNNLLFGLAPIQDPEFSGAVLIGEYDGSVQVVVYLISTLRPLAEMTGSPVAQPGTTPTVIATPAMEISPDTGETAGATGTTGQSNDTTPTSEPSVAAGDQAATEVTIEMVDIDFNPNELTIPADTDVTIMLPNNGVTVHSFVINDHNNENLPFEPIRVEVQPGESGTVTINAPAGEYYFWCDIPGHEAAGMFGTLTVE